MIRELPEGSIWSVGGVGDCQLKMNVLGIAAGGGIRVGLEDNIWYDEERTRLASNSDLLNRIIRIADTLGCTPYTPSEARELLGVGQRIMGQTRMRGRPGRVA